METTRGGQKWEHNNGQRLISDFDLTPVYNTYEEYFSGFDRFRIAMLNGPWQKKYGYPYERVFEFSQRELQEMFLKKFRFEKFWDAGDRRRELNNDITYMNFVRDCIWENRIREFYEMESEELGELNYGSI